MAKKKVRRDRTKFEDYCMDIVSKLHSSGRPNVKLGDINNWATKILFWSGYTVDEAVNRILGTVKKPRWKKLK